MRLLRQSHQPLWLALVLLLLALALLLLGLGVGSTGLQSLQHLGDDPLALQIILDIRLPRSLGAWLAGALLGLAGALAQGLFRNPLADPYLLGSAAGAELGVALALLAASVAVPQGADAVAGGAGGGWHALVASLGLSCAAFVGALLAVLLTLALARAALHGVRLLLAGVIVGVVLGALRDLLTLAAPQVLQAMQAFTLGNTAFINWSACALMGLTWLLCSGAAWALGRSLDGLRLGETTARSLGVPLDAVRLALIAVLALATGAAVAQTGLIAFVGLAAPHVVRSLVHTSHRWLLLLSSAMGGVLLLASDIAARWLLAPQELPVGVVTAVLGGSYLLWLLSRNTRGLP